MASHSRVVTAIQVTTPKHCFLESLRLDYDLPTHVQWTRICELLSLSDRDTLSILIGTHYILTVLLSNGVKKS